jgi:1-deoxy-D-xylulose-5-phosphate synthase
VPQRFLDHAARAEVLAESGLTEQHIARQVTGWVAALAARAESVSEQVD